MCKNIGNIGYFQKNKKKVLSLIGVGLLSGTAVIGGFLPYQEVAEVNKAFPENKISSNEKFRIPPHLVDLQDQDKLSRSVNKRMSYLTTSASDWTYLGTLDNYDVYRRIKSVSTTTKIYQIGGISKLDGAKLGFACICSNISGTATWQGFDNSACGATDPNVAKALNDPIMWNVYHIDTSDVNDFGFPSGACCKSSPKVNGTSLPGLSSCSLSAS